MGMTAKEFLNHLGLGGDSFDRENVIMLMVAYLDYIQTAERQKSNAEDVLVKRVVRNDDFQAEVRELWRRVITAKIDGNPISIAREAADIVVMAYKEKFGIK